MYYTVKQSASLSVFTRGLSSLSTSAPSHYYTHVTMVSRLYDSLQSGDDIFYRQPSFDQRMYGRIIRRDGDVVTLHRYRERRATRQDFIPSSSFSLLLLRFTPLPCASFFSLFFHGLLSPPFFSLLLPSAVLTLPFLPSCFFLH